MNEPIRYFTVEGAGETFVHPIGLAMLVLCGLLMVILPRRYALWSFAVLTCFVSARQCIAVFGANLYFSRVMILVFGAMRVLTKGELRGLHLNVLDWAVLAYGSGYFLAGAINWGLDPVDMKTRAGYCVDIVGTYLLMRILVRDLADVRSIALCLALISIPLLGFFSVEYATGRNLFSVFGGVPEVTAVREGRLRCQGAFGHPILAGVFWASFIPLLAYGAYTMVRHRAVMVAGLIAACGIVVLSASSTSVLGALAAVVGLVLYPFRRYVRHGFLGFAILLVVLHFVMKGPVWGVISRIDVTAGNSGWHRFVLIDGFIRHWDEWWLVGSRTGTAHWGSSAQDTANQFVAAGVQSGIFVFAIFVTIIMVALQAVGRIGRRTPMLGWTLGLTIVVYCLCFLGISIWAQLAFAWSVPLAILGSLGWNVPWNRGEAARRTDTGTGQITRQRSRATMMPQEAYRCAI